MKDSLKQYVEDFIQKNPFIEDWLYNQYINITSLALILQPYFREKLKEDISFEAVKMAIFRAWKKIKFPNIRGSFQTKDIFIKKWINIAYIKLEFKEIAGNIKKVNNKYLTRIHWTKEIAIIFDDYYKKEIAEKFPTSLKKEKLILVWVDMKEWIYDSPWVFYAISKNLFFYSINIIQTLQTFREFSVVVEEKDLKDTVYAISSI